MRLKAPNVRNAAFGSGESAPWNLKAPIRMRNLRKLELETLRQFTRATTVSLNCCFKGVKISDELEGVQGSIIREISFLREMEHSNIVRLLDVLNTEEQGWKKVYHIFEYMDVDLKKFMDTCPEIAKDPHVIKVDKIYQPSELFCQMIHGGFCITYYCHSHKILHRDLRPHNLLIDSNKRILKLADFGSSREVGVPLKRYSGGEEVRQYSLYEYLNPQPPKREEDMITLKLKNLAEVVPDLEPARVDLLSKMLHLKPRERITAYDALNHLYFSGVETL